MKKFLCLLVCAFMAAIPAIGLTACNETKKEGAVNLVAVSGTQVGIMDEIDYYVVAEPAATARVKAVPGLNFAGDLQELYGGDNGYPQAVVVAKTRLISESSFVSNFVSALSNNYGWLANENTSVETIVSAVQGHLTEGMTPTFDMNNLTKQVIENCGINFVSAQDGKSEIISFMQKINSVSDTPFGLPSDNFFWDGSCGEALYNGKVSVYAPDGAPALGLANLLAGEEQLNGNGSVNYEIVAASTIQTYVSGENPKADICVLPVNLAVKLLGNGQKYTLVGTLTHGNLYIVSKNGTQITAQTIQSLKGKTVGVVNLSAVPGLTFKLILKNNGLDFVEIV